mgnify:CR=1 FL=1
MAVTIIFLAVVGSVIAWWLSRQRLTSKPWLEEGAGEPPAEPGGGGPIPAAKLGLWVFLAVVGSLFALFISAYSMRMHMGDWRPLSLPDLLWVNTGLLIFSSFALHRAVLAARREDGGNLEAALLAGAVSAAGFLIGQILAWRQMAAGGVFLASSPAASFFYLITVVHGLHLAGGLVALTRAGIRVARGGGTERTRLSVELCAVYWHFLLLVWVVLFALLLLTRGGTH